jgi:hypothetical protein
VTQFLCKKKRLNILKNLDKKKLIEYFEIMEIVYFLSYR